MTPPSVTITEAARRLGVSTKTIRRRISDGSLAAHKASGPGGFVYRVTDPSVLVIAAGESVARATSAKQDQGGWPTVVKDLLDRLSEAERRAQRAEWELDILRADLATPPALPAPSADVSKPRWTWPWSRRKLH